MNNIGFKNYEEFKSLFIREDGKKKNTVLLNMWRDREFMKFIRLEPMYNALRRVNNMADLMYMCDLFVRTTANGGQRIDLMGHCYYNDIYSTSEGGICADGDMRSYRYYNKERESVFKMRIGKLYKHLILSSEFGKHLPESVILYMCEEMTQKWITYAQSKVSGYELHVDDDFGKIYDGDSCEGDFHSCMTNGDNYHFYEDAVEAKAAYLVNQDDMIVARCVIYTNAKGEDGKVYRLAERQYSTKCDDLLKRLLIHALIKGNHIDGYKKVGAGCHDPRLWMGVDDNPLPCTKFEIECNLDDGDTVSYQDSFKWYDYHSRKAYNYNPGGLDDILSTTDDTIELHEDENYDSWNEEWTDDNVVDVYSSGHHYTCSEERLSSFRWVDGRDEYHHEDDVYYCEECDSYFLAEDGYYSDALGASFCSEECRDDAESRLAE